MSIKEEHSKKPLGNEVVLCKHDECKEELTCLYYQLAVSKKETIDELQEGFPDIDIEGEFGGLL
mgnify:FL=1